MNEPSLRLARIARVSGIIATICGILLIMLPIFLGSLSFAFPKFLLMQPVADLFPQLNPEDLSTQTKAAAFGAIMVNTLPMLWVLWTARPSLVPGLCHGCGFYHRGNTANQTDSPCPALHDPHSSIGQRTLFARFVH